MIFHFVYYLPVFFDLLQVNIFHLTLYNKYALIIIKIKIIIYFKCRQFINFLALNATTGLFKMFFPFLYQFFLVMISEGAIFVHSQVDVTF